MHSIEKSLSTRFLVATESTTFSFNELSLDIEKTVSPLKIMKYTLILHSEAFATTKHIKTILFDNFSNRRM